MRVTNEQNKIERRETVRMAEERLKKQHDKKIGNVKVSGAEDPNSDNGESDDDFELEHDNNSTAHVRKAAHEGCSAAKVNEILKKLDAQKRRCTETFARQIRDTINDVSEVYSPPRIFNRVAKFGLRPGVSLDLICVNAQREP